MAISAFSLPSTDHEKRSVPAVLACVDPGPGAPAVVAAAARIAKRFKRPLIIFHAMAFDRGQSRLPDPLDWHMRCSEVRRQLEDLRQSIAIDGFAPMIEVADGCWLSAIKRHLRTDPRPLVVIGESNSGNTAHLAACLLEGGVESLLVVPTGPTAETGRKGIVVPIDGSKFADAALAEAIGLAQASDAELVLLHAMPCAGIDPVGTGNAADTELQRLIDRHNRQAADELLLHTLQHLRDHGLRARSRCLKGDARASLHAAMVDEAPALVVMSTRGQGLRNCENLSLGSTVQYQLDHLVSPVMLVAARIAGPEVERIKSSSTPQSDAIRGPLNNVLSAAG